LISIKTLTNTVTNVFGERADDLLSQAQELFNDPGFENKGERRQ
jgi:hypothetical protein